MSHKSIAIPTKELSHQKIILAAWYNFLKETFDSGSINSQEFTDFLKANIVFDMDKDKIDLVLTSNDTILEQFRTQVFGTK